MFHMFYFESNLVDSKSLSYKIHFAILLHISHRNVKYIFRIWIRISIYWFRMGVQVQLITFVHILRTFCIKWIDCFLIQFVSLPCFSILRWMLVWPNRHGVINFQIYLIKNEWILCMNESPCYIRIMNNTNAIYLPFSFDIKIFTNIPSYEIDSP